MVADILASSGKVEILGMQRLLPEDGQATPSQLTLPVYDFAVDGVVTSLQWRPVQELALLVCHLGSGQSNSSQTSSGNVWFLPIHGHDRSEVTLSSIAPTKVCGDFVQHFAFVVRHQITLVCGSTVLTMIANEVCRSMDSKMVRACRVLRSSIGAY